ncbi:MAG TPA: PH domain-containing protein [Roseiflexaceae bacterium]|nr:PH domain-containing protein [Roseiflexaceae bacterium]
MRHWKPQPSPGRWVAAGLLLAALAGAALALARIAGRLAGPPEVWRVDVGLFGLILALLGLLAAAGWLAYRTAAALTLGYELDRNGLYITWLGNRAVVPLDRITSIDIGAPEARLPLGSLQGIGYYWGTARLPDGGRLHLFATQPPARCLVVYTPEGAYAISPADHEAFVQDLEQRRNLGAAKPLTATLEPSRFFLYAFWNDRTVRGLLLLALLLNLVALGALAARYPGLSALVELRFDATGEVAELRPRHQALFLPLAAFGLSLLNTALGLALYQRERLGARLLQGASVIVQLLFAVALATVIL